MPRPRLPRRVKEARGTLKKSREVARPPEPPAGKIPDPPRGLKKREAEVWRELSGEVEALKTYSVSDYTAFRLLVATITEADDAPADMAPTAKAALLRIASSMLGAFGLTPGSRGKVERLTDDVPDELKEFGLRAIPGGKGK